MRWPINNQDQLGDQLTIRVSKVGQWGDQLVIRITQVTSQWWDSIRSPVSDTGQWGVQSMVSVSEMTNQQGGSVRGRQASKRDMSTTDPGHKWLIPFCMSLADDCTKQLTIPINPVKRCSSPSDNHLSSNKDFLTVICNRRMEKDEDCFAIIPAVWYSLSSELRSCLIQSELSSELRSYLIQSEFRAQELCESRGGRHELPVPNSRCGRKVTLDLNNLSFGSCDKFKGEPKRTAPQALPTKMG